MDFIFGARHEGSRENHGREFKTFTTGGSDELRTTLRIIVLTAGFAALGTRAGFRL